MHGFAVEDRRTLAAVADWIADRLAHPERLTAPYDAPARLPEVGGAGIGLEATWAALRDQVLPTAFPTDHPRYLAFVGGAPTPAAVLADAALSAASVYGGSELEAGAAVAAERAALRWLCDLAGYPDQAHGAFVSGGSIANLSALVAARHARSAHGTLPRTILAGAGVHASVDAAAAIMGCVVERAGAPDEPLRAADLKPVLDALDPRDVVAVVASAGATNTGAVDALAEIADLCAGYGLWLHVDAAYGGAALLVPAERAAFDGIERADSLTIDPHKWLFTPFDCAAVLYREPELARAAHRQRAPYLESAYDDGMDNPADYAVHLTRRARGLPLWASLVAHGADAYRRAVESCLATARYAAGRVAASAALELAAEPGLSVVLLRRRGWTRERYDAWSRAARADGFALVTPTTVDGAVALRLCFVNPHTTRADVDRVLAALEETG
ncbi:pyridoxal phosphate-dependent decarboxylase family protein [Nocardioides nitrophenolicus]|uniref:pyridoxal phosphate-dependent decarboxylase family protein n=1 Tax=Nocardioides nitrophenolicus TaxID=60489 RepID=UPI00195B5F48|nr:aminotransferase class I/II-fold pyridoxal phosphate-dependent enzyme [Nocardioides nitrophenolicus]MBM7519934.1 glutamate/tyrosine decarboxylase-like PLP-dependent enzyme [Nocardioides nitrophenolicus]